MPTASPEEVRARLEAIVAKRGYLLAHHGLLAATIPDMLAAYDTMYTAIALTPRTLSEHDKEFIWLVVLVTAEEAIATHHIRKFREFGGTDAEIEAAILLAGYVDMARTLGFVEAHWHKQLPTVDRDRLYRAGLDGLMAGRPVPRGLMEMAMVAAATCRKAWREVEIHIRGAYAAGVPEVELAEALVVAMFPGSVPNFADTCRVWQQLVRDGKVPASESFRLWATLEAGTPDNPKPLPPA